MGINYELDPKEIFHLPALHDGLEYADEKPDWIVRPVEGANIRLFSESDDDALRNTMELKCDTERNAILSPIFEVRSSPVVLSDAEFSRGYAQISGRILLSGAAGARARISYNQANKAAERQELMLRTFRQSRNDGKTDLDVYAGDASTLDVALELRNGFNYYHYTAETLGMLSHFTDLKSPRKIKVHVPGKNIKGFIKRFIDAIYPEISDLVEITPKKGRYERVRSVYCHNHHLYTMNDASAEAVLHAEGNDPRWAGAARNPKNTFYAAKYSFDSSLRLLREKALSHVTPEKLASMPKLVWMGRDEASEGARARGLTGHEELWEEFKARGFENVVLENLTPIDQVAVMHAADIVVAPHGAGLVNMVYSREGARVVEIGTRQTQLHRWGDFLKCAHVSRCNTDVVFADVAGLDDLGKVPPMSAGHQGIHVGKRATERLISIVDQDMGKLAER